MGQKETERAKERERERESEREKDQREGLEVGEGLELHVELREVCQVLRLRWQVVDLPSVSKRLTVKERDR